MSENTRIAIIVSDELKQDFKILLAKKNQTAKEFVTELITREIEKNKKEELK